MEALSLLGLTATEQKVYLAVLRLGSAGGTEIRNESGTANSQTYAALQSLIDHGLIIYEKHAHGKRYKAVDPEAIAQILKERQELIARSIPELRSLQNMSCPITDSSVHEGYAGFKIALQAFAEATPEKEEILIIGFSAQDYRNEKLAALLRDVNKRHLMRDHRFRMIVDQGNPFAEQRRKEGFTVMRTMPEGFESPAAINIAGDSVLILLWDETPYAFTVRNPRIAKGFRNYFEFLWKLGTP